MKKLLFVLLALGAYASAGTICTNSNACTVTGSWKFNGGLGVPHVTVANLSTLISGGAGTVAIATNGTTTSDCTIGGGSSWAWCAYNGVSWVSIGGTTSNVQSTLWTFNAGVTGTGNTGSLTAGSGITGTANTWSAQQNLNGGFTSTRFYYDPSIKHFKTWATTYGTFDSAASMSVSAGAAAEPSTQVEGLTVASQLSTYASRDSVAFYSQNVSQAPWLTTSNTTFTSTTVTSSDFASISSLAKVGMIIDVQGSPVISGIVTVINGNTYTVSGWYKVDGSSTTQTPSNGASAVVNPATSIWSLNSVTSIPSTGYATKAIGYENDVYLGKAGTGANSLGFEAVNLASSVEAGYAAYHMVGSWTRGYQATNAGAYGFQSTSAGTTNFLGTQVGNVGTNFISQNGSVGVNSQGDATGFLIDDATTTAFNIRQSGVSKMAIDNAGNINAPSLTTTGANGGVDCTEGTGAGVAAASGHDLLWCDSTAHKFKFNYNNGASTGVITNGAITAQLFSATGGGTVANATTYYTGPIGKGFQSTLSSQASWAVPQACVLTNVTYYLSVGGTLDTAANTHTFSLDKNAGTAVASTSNSTLSANAGMSQVTITPGTALAAGDQVRLKVLTPTYTTLPTSIIFGAYITCQ